MRKRGVNDPSKTLIEQYRIVHDYRRLNNNIIPDSYPLYHIYDLIDRVAQAKVWSVIDLSSGFFNQSLEEESRKYTAFGLVGSNHFEYTRSPQGIRNSPASFQRMLDAVIKELPNCYVYIDDVVVASKNHEEHLRDLQAVFDRFRKYNIKCRLGKLQIGAPKITYLGYDISRKDGIQPGALKCQVIRNWKPPTDVHQIRQFIGLCSFFRRAIHEYAQIASPLIRLTRKDSSWKSGILPVEALKAFETLRAKLSSRPCLKPVDFGKEFILTTDASTVALGAILSQTDERGIEHPCAYASRVLKEPEKKLAPFHLEHLAMLWGCRHFQPYLAGRHFTLRTDHRPLMTLNRVQGQALDRIRADLQEFEPFTVKYIPGKIMPADGLSRLDQTAPISERKEMKGTLSKGMELGPEITRQAVVNLQKEDKAIKAIACYLKYNSWPRDPNLNKMVLKLHQASWLEDGMVMINHQIYAPKDIRHTLLHLAHNDPLSGHFGVGRTEHALRQRWYWPTLHQDVVTHIGQCIRCLEVNVPKSYSRAPLGELPLATHFNQRIHLDLLGPLPSTHGNNYKYILLITDAFSHWTETVPLVSKEAANVAEAFHTHWICRFSCAETVITDQGSEFTARVFKNLLEKYQIDHRMSSVMHPQSNGAAERMNRVMVNYLRKYLTEGPNWDKALPMLRASYNNSPHSTTKVSPYRLLFGRLPTYPSDLFVKHEEKYYGNDEGEMLYRNLSRLHQETIEHQQEAFLKQKKEHDKRIRELHVQEGDIVFVNRPHSGKMFQKFQPLFMGPYRVIQMRPNNNVQLQDQKTFKEITVHTNRIKLAPYLNQHFILRGAKVGGEPPETDRNDRRKQPKRQSSTGPVLQGSGCLPPNGVDEEDPEVGDGVGPVGQDEENDVPFPPTPPPL